MSSKKEMLTEDLNNIELSTNNPRFTTIPSIDSVLIQDILEGNIEYNEGETVINLLKREGTLKDFVSLLKSISTSGFDFDIEEILVVKKEEKFVVAEGNRRILALKLLNNLIEMPSRESIDSGIYIDSNLVNEEDENQNTKDKFEKNYKMVLKLIKNYKEEYKNKYANITIIKDDDVLWKLIYTKHIVGERPGMRKWPRGKYFVDLLNFFPGGLKPEEEEENSKIMLQKIQRSFDSVKSDYKHAQFVRDVFWSKYDFDESKIEIVYESMKSKMVSALQMNFSIKRIEEIIVKKMYLPKQYLKEKINISFDKDFLIKYEANGISKLKILSFILTWYNAGAITTRPIKKSLEGDFSKAVSNMIKVKEVENIKSFNDIDNVFSYSKENLNKLKDNSKDPENKSIIQSVINITDNNEKILKMETIGNFFEIKENEPMANFDILHKQLVHNIGKVNMFLNAVGSTLRSILEQVLIWGVYFDSNIDSYIMQKFEKGSNLEERKEYYLGEIGGKGVINSYFRKIRDYLMEKHLKNEGKTILKNIILNISKLNEESSLNVSEFILEKSDEINSILNESIHASHRIYSKKMIKDFLPKFENWQKNIILIIENLDFDKIKTMSDKLSKKINS